MVRNMRNRGLLIPMLLVFPAVAWGDVKVGNLYSTWEGFEPDKCASIWLIKRHIDRETTAICDRSGPPRSRYLR